MAVVGRFISHDINNPGRDRYFRYPIARIVFAPQRRIVSNKVEVRRGKKPQVVFVRPDNIDDRTRVRDILHHDPDRLAALRWRFSGKSFVVNDAHSCR